jgi:uncharacterized protein YjdB
MADWLERVRRWTRNAGIVAGCVAAAACSDSSSINGIAPGHARLSLAPQFATTPAGGPVVTLSRIDAYLISPTNDSTFSTSPFVEGQATLSFDIPLPGSEAEVTLDLTGFDANGVEAYHARQKYRIKAGNNDGLSPPVLEYSAPDSKVQSIHVEPGSVTLDAGASTTLTISGTDATEAPVSPVRVGWTSRDPAIASVDDGGVVTAMQLSGQTYIVARTPTNVADSVLVTTRGAVIEVVASPSSLSLFRGASAAVSVVARDPAGNTLAERPATFSSSDDKIASVSTTGVVSGVAVGSATITATVEGKSTTVPVTVASPVAGLELTPSSLTMSRIEESQQLTARVVPQTGASTEGLVPTFKSSNESVVTVDAGGRVTATGFGTATITASIETFTATTSVSVVSALMLSPPSIEKLPKGTQQFTVISGGSGPFTWTVNGVVGGNATYGTISTTGFYYAPSAVPSPASFQVCAIQAEPASQGCAKVTINPIPTSGADVIVFNDINSFDDGAGADPNNVQLFKNLVNYTGPGSRPANKSVLLTCGHVAKICATGTVFAATMKAEGYAMTTSADSALPVPIPADVKLLILSLPSTSYSIDEINAMKQFSAEGGRILFIGEYESFLGPDGVATENDFFTKMGAVMRNAGQQIDCGINIVTPDHLRPHQVTTGLTGLTMGCASEVVLGPNDYPLYVSMDGLHVLAAVAKVDVTPLASPGANRRPLSTPRLNRVPSAATSAAIGDPAGWHLVKKKTP